MAQKYNELFTCFLKTLELLIRDLRSKELGKNDD